MSQTYHKRGPNSEKFKQCLTIFGDFSQREFANVLQLLKSEKALGPNFLCPKLILHAGFALKFWLNKFLSSWMCQLKLPKIWRRVLAAAILKPNKLLEDPKSYRPISLICVTLKILKRFIYAYNKPTIDPLLPRGQAGFRHKKATINQVTRNFGQKEGQHCFVNLTAAYNTVWYHGFTCKLLCLLGYRHMVSLIMEVLPLPPALKSKAGYNTLRMASYRNQSSLNHFLFNIYTYDLPVTISKKFA